MDLKLGSKIGKIPVIVDDEKDLTEVIAVDRVAIVSYGPISMLSGIAMFSLAFGGLDSTGKFHLDMKREVINVAIHRQQLPAAFDTLFTDKDGLPRTDIDIKLVTKDVLLPVAYFQHWGRIYKDLDIYMDDEMIFSSKTTKNPFLKEEKA